jgi:hypothetical protein
MSSEGDPPYKRNGMGAAVLADAAGGKDIMFLYGGVKGDEGILYPAAYRSAVMFDVVHILNNNPV